MVYAKWLPLAAGAQTRLRAARPSDLSCDDPQLRESNESDSRFSTSSERIIRAAARDVTTPDLRTAVRALPDSLRAQDEVTGANPNATVGAAHTPAAITMPAPHSRTCAAAPTVRPGRSGADREPPADNARPTLTLGADRVRQTLTTACATWNAESRRPYGRAPHALSHRD